ncbi:ABC transporter ATP-binding protein [Rhodopila sp.]|uniref:ABC transporter ATP-binding protein n=1 Tax=Rhodopila sp. TaxID=2480087 RepID=UPI002BA9B792|nr:ABC transporter ATP-binding protein [Rhodopila sp.]HVZ06903.1 ABC transporter ATP-binding protein [Rhodopila sp.]
MLRRFERLLDPTAGQPDPPPTAGLMRFYWHFIRQVRGLTAALFVCGGLIAILDTMIPAFIGRVVGFVSTSTPDTLFADHGPALLGMAAILVLARPAAFMAHNILVNQVVNPGFSNMIRWQNHWHVVRQSWTFFQNDFAGRIANRVQQTGPALRESLVMAFDAAWYIVVYGSSALLMLAHLDWRLMVPMTAWFGCYAVMLRYFVPRLRDRSRRVSEMRSTLTGRIVDSYTNILTVKLFAKALDEDAFVRDAVDDHTRAFRDQTRLTSGYTMTLSMMNALLVVGTATVALWQWTQGQIVLAAVATAIPLSWQLTNIAGWVARSITSIFENIGTVQDGMRSIDVARQMPDPPGVTDLHVHGGEIRFEDLHFDYGRIRDVVTGRQATQAPAVLHGIDLTIAAGERVGLVGPSGAGKSTLVNLLLHFYDPARGRILIDGQDIARVTQESLRAHIAMVTQDTSLLHRSIRDNIRYGRPDATEAQVIDAARKAEAHDFIMGLEDWHGRRGYDAHVGERGVKLSGGQRQRVALARVILKDAPILILDEATSALDSEVEAAIQGQLDRLMEGRTVIAIAHRLSTIARMDRLIVLNQGRIVESGSHAELLRQGGVYARLWHRQSGGFQADGVRSGEYQPADAAELRP